MLTNSTWLYDLMGVNNTNLVHDYYINHDDVRVDYPWEFFRWNLPGPTPPTPPTPSGRRSKFPWVLYSRKLREKHMSRY